jgi:transglutaminase/protease-like cytokinesis protein 3
MSEVVSLLALWFFFFLIGKQIALKKCKDAPKHIESIQKGHQNKRKTKNRRRTPEKPKRQ